MEKGVKKVLKWELIGGGALLVILLMLSVAGLFSFYYFLAAFFGIIVLGSLVWAISIFVRKKRGIKEKEPEKIITFEDARQIAKNRLLELDILEKEKELIWESPAYYFGVVGGKTPVYVRVIETHFERKILGILVNRFTGEPFTRFYKLLQLPISEIEKDLLQKANLLAKEPSPLVKTRKIKRKSHLTGVEEEEEIPIEEKKEKPEDKKEGFEGK